MEYYLHSVIVLVLSLYQFYTYKKTILVILIHVTAKFYLVFILITEEEIVLFKFQLIVFNLLQSALCMLYN